MRCPICKRPPNDITLSPGQMPCTCTPKPSAPREWIIEKTPFAPGMHAATQESVFLSETQKPHVVRAIDLAAYEALEEDRDQQYQEKLGLLQLVDELEKELKETRDNHSEWTLSRERMFKEKLDEARAEAEAQQRMNISNMNSAHYAMERAEARAARLIEALEYYAHLKIHQHGYQSDSVEVDKGETARRAIRAHESEGK